MGKRKGTFLFGFRSIPRPNGRKSIVTFFVTNSFQRGVRFSRYDSKSFSKSVLKLTTLKQFGKDTFIYGTGYISIRAVSFLLLPLFTNVFNKEESRPLNLLFYSIFEWAIQKSVTAFDFGIFTVKEEPNFGLARFKENFGVSGIFRDTLELKLH